MNQNELLKRKGFIDFQDILCFDYNHLTQTLACGKIGVIDLYQFQEKIGEIKIELNPIKIWVSPDGLYLLISDRNQILIKSIQDQEIEGVIKENLKIKYVIWSSVASKVIVLFYFNVILIYDLETKKTGQITNLAHTRTPYEISNSNKLLAVLEQQNGEFFVEIYNIETMQSISVCELNIKNPEKIIWGREDHFIMVKESLFSNQILFFQIDGICFLKLDEDNLNFSISKLYPGKSKCLMLSYDDQMMIYSLDYFQDIKRLPLKAFFGQKSVFFKEIEEINPNKALAKIRKIQYQQDQTFQTNDYTFSQIKISLYENYCAMILTSRRDHLIIMDFQNYKIECVYQFIKPIKKIDWSSGEELVIITGEHCFYYWNQNQIHIMEHYYQKQFFFNNMKIYPTEKIWIFQDTNVKQILYFNRNSFNKFVGWDNSSLGQALLTQNSEIEEKDDVFQLNQSNEDVNLFKSWTDNQYNMNSKNYFLKNFYFINKYFLNTFSLKLPFNYQINPAYNHPTQVIGPPNPKETIKFAYLIFLIFFLLADNMHKPIP